MYTFRTTQQLNCSIEEAWDFFSSPHNLAVITPPEMKFTVRSKLADEPIFEGMLIDYYVTPLFGIKMKWRTEITQVDFQKSFTDYQLKGPYKRWNHQHLFFPNEQGVLMEDIIHYKLPFGFLGKLAHPLLVKRKIKGIFDYRKSVLDQKFN